MSYEPEADVLRVELAQGPIDYVKEMGNVAVHFSPEGAPVYLELLEAKNFLLRFERVFKKQKVSPLAKEPA